MSAKPKTLQQAMVYFADVDNGLKFMVECRWPHGVECPACGREDVRFISTRRMWECKSQHPKKQFSVKIGTCKSLSKQTALTSFRINTYEKDRGEGCYC
jgi:Transposase zinc-ribbon domain